MKTLIKVQKRKKIRVIIALILTLIIILLAAIAAFFHLGQNSDEKRQYEEKIRQEAGEFTGELITELDQVDTSDEGISQADTAEPDEDITESEKQLLSKELAKQTDERKRQVLKTLTAAYSKTLQAQKREAFNQVEALVAQGKADWNALKASGENTAANKGALASEYLAKSQVLEAQMDASFQTLIGKMEEQLESEGIDPEPIIKEYEAEYKRIKDENRSAMMDKAMAAVKNK